MPDTATEVLQAAAAELTAGLASLLGAAPVRTAAAQGGQFILLDVRGDAPKIDKGYWDNMDGSIESRIRDYASLLAAAGRSTDAAAGCHESKTLASIRQAPTSSSALAFLLYAGTTLNASAAKKAPNVQALS